MSGHIDWGVSSINKNTRVVHHKADQIEKCELNRGNSMGRHKFDFLNNGKTGIENIRFSLILYGRSIKHGPLKSFISIDMPLSKYTDLVSGKEVTGKDKLSGRQGYLEYTLRLSNNVLTAEEINVFTHGRNYRKRDFLKITYKEPVLNLDNLVNGVVLSVDSEEFGQFTKSAITGSWGREERLNSAKCSNFRDKT